MKTYGKLVLTKVVVQKARVAAGFSTKIEVECRSLSEGIEACKAGAEIIMLDNYTAAELIVDAGKHRPFSHTTCTHLPFKHPGQLKELFPHVIIEASGGITERTIQQYMAPCVDVISSGKLTQGYSCLDFSLKIQR